MSIHIKDISVIKVEFHNSKVKRKFSFYNHQRDATFLKFCPLRTLTKTLKGKRCLKDWKEGVRTLAFEHISTQGTLVHEHIST